MELETLLSKTLSTVNQFPHKLIFPKKLTITFSLSPHAPAIHYRFDPHWINWLNANVDSTFDPLTSVHEFFKNEAHFPFFLKDNIMAKFSTFSHIYFLNPLLDSEISI